MRWRWPLLVAGASVLGVIDASQVQYDRAMRGDPITWTHALQHGLPRWYAWALLVPAIVAFARVVHARSTSASYTLLAHGPAAVLFTVVQVAMLSMASSLLHVGATTHVPAAFAKYLGLTFLGGLVTYALVVGAWYALMTHRRARAHEREAAQLALERSRLGTLLAESRLQQLQNQLQPHFLFNALHAVSSLVVEGHATAAVRMTARLSDLLRRSLRTGQHAEIPLSEELQLLEDYLEIQRLRFPDRLRCDILVADRALEARVPTFVLQPLVENAIRHGLEADADAGRVEIRISCENDALEVCIWNDGPPLAIHAERAEGTGIGNTRARLHALYGDSAALSLANAAGGGVAVTLRLPFRCTEPEEPAATSNWRTGDDSNSRTVVR